MKNFWIFVLILVCLFGLAACGTPSQHIERSHGLDVKAPPDSPEMLMKYNSVAQGVEAKGWVLLGLTLVGQSKTPINPPPAAAPPPQQPQQQVPAQMPPNLADAKLRWVPPPAAPCPPKSPPPPPAVLPQPQVLATYSEGGTTTEHDVSTGLSYSVPAAAGYTGGSVGGAAALRPARMSVNQQGGGAAQNQGQITSNSNTNINPNTNINNVNPTAISGSSSGAAANAILKK